jgi:hypothetical protein
MIACVVDAGHPDACPPGAMCLPPPTDAGTPSNLTWYKTCGYPVCGIGPVDAGPQPLCPPVGSPCLVKGQTCGTPDRDNCGVIEVCDDHDPAVMCPISSAKYKTGINYLNEAQISRLHDEAISTKLAVYNYRAEISDPGVPHLGFIVEDQPQSLAVDRGFDRVDMYGYLSMVLAAVQAQDKEIQSLKSQLASSKNACR